MTNYSAAQAISPAIDRTRQFLFQPFRWGRFLKLTLVAALVEGGGASFNVNSPFPGGGKYGPLGHPFHLPHFEWPAMAILVGLAIAFALIVIPIGLLLSYLVIRLRFAYFDCLLRMQDRIAPAWRPYHRQSMRYLGMTILVSLAYTALIGGIGYEVYLHFKPLFQAIFSGGQLTFSDFLPLLATLIPLGMGLALLGFFVETALRAFILPHMAIDDSSIAESFSDVWGNIQEEPGQFALFVLLRGLLTIVAHILGLIILAVPFAVVVGIGALIVLLLAAISKVAAIAVGIPLGAIILALLILSGIGVAGTIGTFRRSYAMFFYASRYPPLGALLEASIPAPQPPLGYPAAPPWRPAAYPGTPQG